MIHTYDTQGRQRQIDAARGVLAALAARDPAAPPPPRPGPRRLPGTATVPVPCSIPGPIEAARRELAWARGPGATAATVASDARACLGSIERFLSVASGAPAWREYVPEARAMQAIAVEILSSHDLRGVL